jgi:hypothetical protein
MTKIDNKRLCLFEGLHYHKWRPVKIYPYLICSLCGVYHSEPNPDYSTSPDDRERLWLYLMGKEEMWEEFFWWCWNSSPKEAQDLRDRFVAWLFLPLDGVPRWVGLLSEWLGMEETREKFGWVECPEFEKDIVCTFIECSQRNSGCAITGRIRAEWAR